MISIDLSGAQKFQIGAVVLVLTLAGYFLWSGTRTPPDMTIASWVTQARAGLDPSKPISNINPADPAKNLVLTTFACFDGKLQVTEYASTSGKGAYFDFAPDSRRTTYQFYKDPWIAIDKISDPYRRTLSFAAYSAAENRPMGLLGRAGMDSDQRKKEVDARTEMNAGVALVDESVKHGTFKSDMYNKVMAAFEDYKKVGGDPTKNAAKAIAAKKFIELAFQYLQAMDQERAKYVEKYIAAVDGILTQAQKDKLGAAVKLAFRPKVAKPRTG